jgi:glycosyltransferase involved in cell wall biosynthesis
MRLCVLSQYYDPEPVPKAGELAREMRQRGHEVVVITGYPNYPTGVLYKGFRLRLRADESIDGIPVTRTYEYPYHGKSVAGRLVNYGSFVASSLLAVRRVRGSDVMYVWHPPLTVGVAAWLLGLLGGVPFVYDVQDIWPEIAVLSGLLRDGVFVRLMQRLERFVYGRAAHLLVVTEGSRQNLIAKGVPAEKITVMPHWIDENAFGEINDETRRRVRVEFGWLDAFIVLFAGNLGMVQGLDLVIRAASNLPRDGSIRIVLMGEGTDKERLVELASTLDISDRVQFVARQSSDRMPSIMGSSDALLVHLRRSELSRLVIPTKTLSYLAAGRPIVMAMEGAAAELVAEAHAGVVIPPGDPPLLASTLLALRDMPAAAREEMGQRGRDYLRRHLTKKQVLDRYERILTSVVESHAR